MNLFSETTDNVAIDFPTSYQQVIDRINPINPVHYSKTKISLMALSLIYPGIIGSTIKDLFFIVFQVIVYAQWLF